MISLIIFDFDDTITDNRNLDYNAFIIPNYKVGLKIPTKKYIFDMRKQGKLAKEIINNYNTDQQKINFFLNLRSKFLNNTNSTDYLKVKPGIKSFLEFSKRKKITCVICTTKLNKKIIKKFLQENDILKYFHNIYSTSDLNSSLDNTTSKERIKIKQLLIKIIISKYLIKKHEILYVGNSSEDKKAIKNYKIHFIYFQNSYLPKSDIKNILTITKFSELKSIIKDFNNSSHRNNKYA